MNLYLIAWVTANVTAAWFYLYLVRRGSSFLTNVGPLFEKLEKTAPRIKTQEQLERYQSILTAARKTGAVGLIYLLLGLVGMLGLVILNARLIP